MFTNFAKITLFGLVICCGVLSRLSFVLAKFPDDPKPCKYEDADCILKTINVILKERFNGDNSINLIKIDPLRVSKMNIKQGAESPVNIDLLFTDNDVFGLSTAEAYKATGFGKDIKGKHELHLKAKSASLVGDYKISGKVLILPISGAGKSNMTITNVDLGLKWTGIPYEKDGEMYMKVENLKLSLDTDRMYFYFGNLFNGDKALGENMNLFLNENWRDIFNEVKESLVEAFAQIFQSVINNVFSKLPYNKYLIE